MADLQRERAVLVGRDEGHLPVHDDEPVGQLVQTAGLGVAGEPFVVAVDGGEMDHRVLEERPDAAAAVEQSLVTAEGGPMGGFAARTGESGVRLDAQDFLVGLLHRLGQGLVDALGAAVQAQHRGLGGGARGLRPGRPHQRFQQLHQPFLAPVLVGDPGPGAAQQPVEGGGGAG